MDVNWEASKMTKLEPKPKLLAVIGPTASGKTSLAIKLAKKFKGEIISADSRQFYRGNEIGSDTVQGEWKKIDGRRVYMADGVLHHMVAFRSINKPISLAEFQRLAIRKAKEIIKRGNLPILCGGTGLYVLAVTDNYLMPESEPDLDLRAKLDEKKTETLFKDLKKKDPEYAKRISSNNRRYIIRALEVIAVTGQPFSQAQSKGEPIFDVLKIGVSRPRPELYSRIDSRVDELMKIGILEEAKRLGKRYGWDLPAMSGLGHRQLGMYLHGEVDLDEAVRLIKRDTRHYARRQLIWWRRDSSVQWVKGVEESVKLTRDFLKKMA